MMKFTLTTYFTKLVKDNFLWQLIDFPTRKDVLDLLLTNIPDKITNISGFEDIITTDHKLINFQINLQIPKRNPSLKYTVYKFKSADWNGLKQTLTNTPWNLVLIKMIPMNR